MARTVPKIWRPNSLSDEGVSACSSIQPRSYSSTDKDFVCAFSLPNNLGSPVRSNPPDDVLTIEEEYWQDMVFKRFPGESVCNFDYTKARYEHQLAAAEIRIPKRVKKERLAFLKARAEGGCLTTKQVSR